MDQAASAAGLRVAIVQCRMRDILMDYRFQSENVGLGLLAAVARALGAEVDILDAHLHLWKVGELLERLLSGRYDIIGFSCSAQEAAFQTFYVIETLRQRGVGAHICLGGHYATFDWREILPNVPGVDSIVMNEGELTWIDLLQRIARNDSLIGMPGLGHRTALGAECGPGRPLIESLDSLPYADRDDFELVMERNLRVALTASRGCYANCSFCTIPSFYGNRIRRRRTPANIVGELAGLYERGARKFRFNDDIFIDRSPLGRRWVLEICDRLLDHGINDLNLWLESRASDFTPEVVRRLLEVGLRKVFVGIESGSQSQLDRYNKQLRAEDNVRALRVLSDQGIPEVTVGFIMFDADTRLEDIQENIEFLKSIGQGHIGNLFSRLVIYKGAPIYPVYRERGILRFRHWMDVPEYTFTDERVTAFFEQASEVLSAAEPHVRFDFRVDIVDRRFQRVAGGLSDPEARATSEALGRLVVQHRDQLARAVLDIYESVFRHVAYGDPLPVPGADLRQEVAALLADSMGDVEERAERLMAAIASHWGVAFSFEVEDAERLRHISKITFSSPGLPKAPAGAAAS